MSIRNALVDKLDTAELEQLDAGGELYAQPSWSPHGVPDCSQDECGLYDGKRCRAMGMRPSRICEPVVERMAERLITLRSGR